MSKTVFVSNRLPVTISVEEEGFSYSPSIGGLATGLKSVHAEGGSLWVGWCGLSRAELSDAQVAELTDRLQEDYQSVPVFLSEEEMESYYYGFCNRTIWPLFHYFNSHAEYDHAKWQSYCDVNRKFFDRLSEHIEDGDTVWVHDYQLLLLPQMIREAFPNTQVGFFLHIPFPSFEIFRLLPWREELLRGILGADLIGFHTYDYVRHFLSSVRRLLGYEHQLGDLIVGDRLVKTDVFPMGIDYERYHRANEVRTIQEETEDVLAKARGTQILLSVDRLDYTKGIPMRIRAFAQFLQDNPDYREKVTLILIVAPSRTEVDTYHDLLKEVQELVSTVNGEHGAMGWTPIWFFFRSFGFESLAAIYSASDALLVTPLRDGMNLVAKEFVAACDPKKGMLVLSEAAGAASELGEAVIVNPNNVKQVAAGIREALEMDPEVKAGKNALMRKRLSRYNVEYWAQDFLRKLSDIKSKQALLGSAIITPDRISSILDEARAASRRLFLLDYDGTLSPFFDKPEDARPDAEVRDLLQQLGEDERNQVLIISGRDRHCLTEWFDGLPVSLSATHGLWSRDLGGEWILAETLSDDWKETIRPILDVHTARTPGSFLEEKDFSLAWHYRRCEPELATVRVNELKDALVHLTHNLNIGLLNGNKVVEIKDTTVNKGRAASTWLTREDWDFVFAAGDDWTDEDMFSILPESAFSVKVGVGMSQARFRARSVDDMRGLLWQLAEKA